MRVLLVDDDENLLAVAKQFMNQVEPSFELITADSASKALKIISREHFDVIVSDYQMPKTNGIQLLEKLRKAGSEIAFIIFTGQGGKEVANKAMDLGVDYYLKKEGSYKSLYEELAQIIRNVMQTKDATEVQPAIEP